MGKKLKAEIADTTNPEWSPADFARARPASEVLPGLFGKAQAMEMLKPKRGRPKAEVTKEHVNLRLDAAKQRPVVRIAAIFFIHRQA